MFDVVAVEFNFFFKIEIAAAIDLRQAGDAGFDGEDKTLVFLIVRHLFREVRARAHQAEIADQHAPQLRQFIETPSS